MIKRTMSMELRAIRAQMNESPPPPPAGASVREWFAGLALMNPELMKDMNPVERAVEAVRLADELIRALAAPRMPSKESLAAPTEAEMAEWDKKVADDNEAKSRRSRATQPDIKGRKKTAAYEFGMLPPPNSTPPSEPPPATVAGAHFRRASEQLRQAAAQSTVQTMPSMIPLPPPTISLKKSPLPMPTRYSSRGPIEEE